MGRLRSRLFDPEVQMKKNKRWFHIRIRPAEPNELTGRLLLLNLYATQAVVFLIGILIVFFQSRNVFELFQMPQSWRPVLWAAGFAALALFADYAASRAAPKEAMDDGGLNRMLFADRPLWHLALICFLVSFCEELLFRGAVQHAIGAYWTSVLFAAVHIRYLRHWLMTGLVFCLSYGLGKIYIITGTLWTPILAHFLIDFVSGCMIRYRRDGD
jgi:membrane protease YdiL (CAAX protease family)